ncbi:MAG: hypothetical protein AAF488_08975 [Planctomycetota bacterium]
MACWLPVVNCSTMRLGGHLLLVAICAQLWLIDTTSADGGPSLGASMKKYTKLFDSENTLHMMNVLEGGLSKGRAELEPDVLKSLDRYGEFLSETIRGPRSRESAVAIEVAWNVVTVLSLASYYVLYHVRIQNDPGEAITACHDLLWLAHSYREQAADGLWYISASGVEAHALQQLATIVAESRPKLEELRLDWIRKVGRTTEERPDLLAKLLVDGFDPGQISNGDVREFLVMAAHDLERVKSLSDLPTFAKQLTASARTPEQRKVVPVIRPILKRWIRSRVVHKATDRGLRGVIKLTLLRLPKEEVLQTIIDPFSGQPARSHPKGFYYVGVNGKDEGGESGDDLLYLTEP